MPPLECSAHGNATRLTCADCGTPICPQCLVKTEVGLKCAEHAQANVAPPDHRRVGPLVVAAVVFVVMVAVVVVAVGQMRSGQTVAVVPVEPAGPRFQTAQVHVMGADGSDPRTLTIRPQAVDAHPSWSPQGDSIAFESTSEGRRAVWVIQADGLGLRRLTDGPGVDGAPAWSPDGARIAFMSDRDGNDEVYVMAADGTGVTRLTDSPSVDGYPAWSPDGTRIAFVGDRPGPNGSPADTGRLRLFVMGADGSGVTPLSDLPAVPDRPAWSPDGRRLTFAAEGDGNAELYVVGVDGSAPTRLTTEPGADGEPAWSPDGTTIAFASNRDGAAQIYTVDSDGPSVRKLTTEPRNFAPSYSPDGSMLVFVHEPVPEGG